MTDGENGSRAKVAKSRERAAAEQQGAEHEADHTRMWPQLRNIFDVTAESQAAAAALMPGLDNGDTEVIQKPTKKG